MDGHAAGPGELSSRTRLEACLPVLPAAAAATWLAIDAPASGGLSVAFAMLFLIPPLVATRRGFVIASLVVAGLPVVATVSVIGVLLGLFLFLPASAATLAATGLGTRNAHGKLLARACLWLVAAGAAAGFGGAAWHQLNPPSNSVIVQLAAPDRGSAEAWRLLGALTRAGFTGVMIGEQGGCYQRLDVEITTVMPERRRQQLLRLVQIQPDVVAAYWCHGTQCNSTQCNV